MISCCKSDNKTPGLFFLGAWVAWLLAVASGYTLLLKYESIPGPLTKAPVIWPSGTSLNLDPNKFTALMFMHPKCGCSRASLNELSKLLSSTKNISVLVIFVRPPGCELDWAKSDIWTSAKNIPGIKTILDDNAQEASIFSAQTSGEMLVYDQAGRLAFSGGITAGRGHEGDNQGLSIVQSITRNELQPCPSAPVFGCPLADNKSPNTEVISECLK